MLQVVPDARDDRVDDAIDVPAHCVVQEERSRRPIDSGSLLLLDPGD